MTATIGMREQPLYSRHGAATPPAALPRAGGASRPHVLLLPSWYPSSPTEFGGSFFREQAIALASAGVQVGVASVHLRSPRRWRSLVTGPRGVVSGVDCGVRTIGFHGVNWWTRLPRLFAKRWLECGRAAVGRYVAMHGKPDLIHAHSLLYGGVLAAHVARQLGIPYVVTEHSSAFALGGYSPWQIELARAAAISAAGRLAVSPSLVETMVNHLGVTESWQVVPNIVHRQFLETPLPGPSRRDRRFTFISLSGMTPNKCEAVLLRAFTRVLQQDPEVVLQIGGDGPERQRLEELARELGIAEHVQFLGSIRRGEVAAAMGAADAFVLTSNYETFGLALVEALALGLPSVSTRCGGPEYTLRQQDGVLVPPGDASALAAAMLGLRRSYERYDRSGIREACRMRFGEATVMAQLVGIYNSVVQGRCVA